MSDPLRELTDQLQIAKLLARYTSALDERDWKKLERCFVATPIAEYGGRNGHCECFADIERLCRSTLEPLDSSHHLIGSIEIDVGGDEARARCSFTAQHTRAAAEGGANFTVGGVYRDVLVRGADGWRIARRELSVAWREGNPGVFAATPSREAGPD